MTMCIRPASQHHPRPMIIGTANTNDRPPRSLFRPVQPLDTPPSLLSQCLKSPLGEPHFYLYLPHCRTGPISLYAAFLL
ncbi:hypothetical protein AG1IA_09558 [Rhizoctonia solani AG-1 IA]|uniref:Uncharacterized protein n=1 Tax=Thanatephorus cucumeris (strain AG1-IA) TaxID=983506 RepID=L8WHZ2_THACA|nr:hypothetical protein AG1IA_09558 [Rhizoctonia solani AG-1 IA]